MGTTKPILVVDDSSSMRQMVALTLSEDGYDVVEAENGSTALKKLETLQTSLIITDINMPKMGGIDLIKSVRAESDHKYIPIVVLTTENENTMKDVGREAGATAWIVKPFSPDVLKETIRKVVGE